jgi:6-pyruvoyltetrahydropterin/6-carboxytetrahydropterin synthase
MYRLTRQVRFSLDANTPPKGVTFTNGYAANPPLAGLGHYLQLNVEVAGPLDRHSGYLLNIRTIDVAVRGHVLPLWRALLPDRFHPGTALQSAFHALVPHLLPATLSSLTLDLSPFLHVSLSTSELNMVRLTHTFEFSAAHRLHNPDLTDAQNIDTFGKCNNPEGHGHNYQLAVSLKGDPGPTGLVMHIPNLEAIVESNVINHLDHKHLNRQVPEFRDLNPSVENIARIIYERLAAPLAGTLDSVTVWETPKTWCEYRPGN